MHSDQPLAREFSLSDRYSGALFRSGLLLSLVASVLAAFDLDGLGVAGLAFDLFDFLMYEVVLGGTALLGYLLLRQSGVTLDPVVRTITHTGFGKRLGVAAKDVLHIQERVDENGNVFELYLKTAAFDMKIPELEEMPEFVHAARALLPAEVGCTVVRRRRSGILVPGTLLLALAVFVTGAGMKLLLALTNAFWVIALFGIIPIAAFSYIGMSRSLHPGLRRTFRLHSILFALLLLFWLFFYFCLQNKGIHLSEE